jgi:hypothetical protein
MSSSISSSRALDSAAALARTPSRLRRTLVLVAVLLVGLEAFTRLKLFHEAKDLRAFRTYPARAAALAARDGLRIAVVGNSITHEDIDPALLAARLSTLTGTPVHADIFSADHSFVDTWHFMLQHYFWRPGNRVDLVLIPFWRQNLHDDNETEVGRLAQFFTSFADWPEILTRHLTTASTRADFVVSSFWATFAARDRVREFVFINTLPAYKRYVRRQHLAMIDHEMWLSGGGPIRNRSLVALGRLLETARARDTTITFMAFPTMNEHWNDPYVEPVRLIEAAGMSYVDLRDIDGFDERSYADPVHMNAAGRARFTPRLAEVLAPYLRCDGRACTVLTSVRAPTATSRD